MIPTPPRLFSIHFCFAAVFWLCWPRQGKVSAAGSAWLSPHTKKRRLQVDEPETRLDLAVNQREPMPRPFFKWTTTIADHMATSDDIVLYFATHDDTVCGWQNWRSDPGEIEIYNTPLLSRQLQCLRPRLSRQGWRQAGRQLCKKPWIQGSRTFLGFGPRICTSGAPRS